MELNQITFLFQFFIFKSIITTIITIIIIGGGGGGVVVYIAVFSNFIVYQLFLVFYFCWNPLLSWVLL